MPVMSAVGVLIGYLRSPMVGGRGARSAAPYPRTVQTRYLLIASVVTAFVILVAGAIYFAVGLGVG